MPDQSIQDSHISHITLARHGVITSAHAQAANCEFRNCLHIPLVLTPSAEGTSLSAPSAANNPLTSSLLAPLHPPRSRCSSTPQGSLPHPHALRPQNRRRPHGPKKVLAPRTRPPEIPQPCHSHDPRPHRPPDRSRSDDHLLRRPGSIAYKWCCTHNQHKW